MTDPPDSQTEATTPNSPFLSEERATGEGGRGVRGIVRGGHNPVKVELAKQFRHEMTPQEARLWQCLRTNRQHGLHFRRQQVIDGFIADFYCHAARLVLEIDGAVHERQADYDAARDRLIATRGIRVVRISNDRIECDLEGTLEQIVTLAMSRLPAEGEVQSSGNKERKTG